MFSSFCYKSRLKRSVLFSAVKEHVGETKKVAENNWVTGGWGSLPCNLVTCVVSAENKIAHGTRGLVRVEAKVKSVFMELL